ncbi:MAG: putative pre6S rRNA nuclease [Actinomycetota bacterium]|jgi:putative Holliday junction resolvase|nr:putative pre6S rRNA nuclease [Actinomycetota bacterium]
MILGVDPGERRVGIAAADLETRMAYPLEVVDRRKSDPLLRIAQLATELEVERIVVGRPTSLSGMKGPAVTAQQVFVEGLREATTVEVTEWDERLTTVLAERAMRAAGASASIRKENRDAVAAQIMLQGYVDATCH